MKIRKISEVLGKRVFVDSGEFFGLVEEVNLFENRIDGWRIKVSGPVTSVIGGARGVIIPHQYVKAISDVFIINRGALPSTDQLLDESPDMI